LQTRAAISLTAWRTRDATVADAAALSRLAEQLGYTASPKDIAERLSRMDSNQERVIAAVDSSEAVVGWTSVRAAEHIHSGACLEISGFVVEEEKRGRGVGKILMAAVELWAREKKLGVVRLNANVTRIRAHRFYESLGFARIKQQYVFKKDLG
jgi:GNAT superfamily N-acetyltransferase